MRRHQSTEPMRRCIGCRQSRSQGDLLRFTLDGAEIVPDAGYRRDGRGFYLCRDTECLEKAIKSKAFNRICKAGKDPDQIREIVAKALETITKEGINV